VVGRGEEKRTLTDLARRPTDAILSAIDAVNDELAAPAHIMDGILEHLDAAGGLDHDVEAVRVLLLDALVHGGGILAAEGHVHVGGVEALGQVDLEALGRGDDDVAAAVLAQHLRQHQPRRPRPEHQHRRAHLRRDLVQPVRGAAGGLEERRIYVGEVLDWEDAAGFWEGRANVRNGNCLYKIGP
jgi:hypothetical protein